MGLNKAERIAGTVVSVIILCAFSAYTTIVEVMFRGYGGRAVLAIIAGLVVVTIAAAVVLHRRFERERTPELIDYTNLGVQRYAVGLLMIAYGLPKLVGRFFDYELSALDSTMARATELQLAWYFYGKNPWQELFAGVMEFVPGCLLLVRRTYYMAALLLLPVIGQVVILNAFFQIGGITLPLALAIFLADAYLVYSQRQRIAAFFRSLDFTPAAPIGGRMQRLVAIGRWVAVVYAIVQVGATVRNEIAPTPTRVRYSALVGAFTLESARKQNEPFVPDVRSDSYSDLYIERQERWNRLRRFDGRLEAFELRLVGERGFELTINRGGAGDAADDLDFESTFRGDWELAGDVLTLKGMQRGEQLELRYVRRPPLPKTWFW
jgi:hypothetical protein